MASSIGLQPLRGACGGRAGYGGNPPALGWARSCSPYRSRHTRAPSAVSAGQRVWFGTVQTACKSTALPPSVSCGDKGRSRGTPPA